jgi:hypothetical protein
MQQKAWEKVDLDNFRSGKTLAINYLTLFYKICLSHTDYFCYFFMLYAILSNGGLLYIVYPLLIFGYALCLEH